ncbi:MAG TPA: YSC84-related protein [Gammaproteobacteria bacterium]|nr:YSC84-related protein [Gammaproteobacteria bacterium]
MVRILTAGCLILALLAAGCATTGGTPTEQRASIQKMKTQVLAELYKQKPDVRAQLASAPGYAVFSNANVNLVLASFGGGYGVVENNRNGGETYMKMGEVGVGIGLGVKDFRLVFVFHNEAAMKRFVDKGWVLGAQADAAAKSNDKGAAVGGEITVDDMTIYQLTETGLALQATIKGTRFWKDEALN